MGIGGTHSLWGTLLHYEVMVREDDKEHRAEGMEHRVESEELRAKGMEYGEEIF